MYTQIRADRTPDGRLEEVVDLGAAPGGKARAVDLVVLVGGPASVVVPAGAVAKGTQ